MGVAALFFVLPTLLAETLETVSVHQQTAVAELVQSLKSTREVLFFFDGNVSLKHGETETLLVITVGLEPTTNHLKVDLIGCSTT